MTGTLPLWQWVWRIWLPRLLNLGWLSNVMQQNELTLTAKKRASWRRLTAKFWMIEVPSLERLIYKNAIAFYADEETRGFKRGFLCCHKRLILWMDVFRCCLWADVFFFSQEKRLRKAWNPKVPNTAMQIAMQVSCRSFTDLFAKNELSTSMWYLSTSVCNQDAVPNIIESP